jgi:4-hydroxy-2-oxoheptanedioate aldolase
MIESQEGLQAVEEIAKVPGVDVLFVGPYDLSLALGIVEQFDNPAFLNALEKVIEAATKAGIAAGLQSTGMSLLTKARDLGARFLIYGSDFSVLLAGYREAMPRLKG